MRTKKEIKYILEFVCYCPQIYSGLDKFFVFLTKKLCAKGIVPIYIYTKTLDVVPQIQKDLENAGAIVETMPEHGKWAIVKSINALYRKYHPILVDVHFVPFVKAYSALYSWAHGIKHVTHIHSLITDGSPDGYVHKKGRIKRLLWGINYALLNKIGKIICVSKAIEKQFREWAYGTSQNAQTLYLGTDLTASKLTKQQAREKLSLSQEDFLFVNISAKEELKSIDKIIESIRGGKFVHIGGLRSNNEINRAYEESLYALVRKLHKEEQVIWLGKRDDIRDILPAFDVYVHPSRSEGLPMSLMEAAAAGLPLIGTKVGGIPELITHNMNGLLLEYGDWPSLNRYMELLRNDSDLRLQMGNIARETAYADFDMNLQTDKLINAYDIKH